MKESPEHRFMTVLALSLMRDLWIIYKTLFPRVELLKVKEDVNLLELSPACLAASISPQA